MMNVRKMRVPMRERFVPVQMAVRTPILPGKVVRVLMMGIVLMDVGMFDGFVLMIVLAILLPIIEINQLVH